MKDMLDDLPFVGDQETPGNPVGSRRAIRHDAAGRAGGSDRGAHQNLPDAPSLEAATPADKRRRTFADWAKSGHVPAGVGSGLNKRALAVHHLRMAQSAHKMGVVALARYLGVASSTVSEWLRGRHLPSHEFADMVLEKLAGLRLEAKLAHDPAGESEDNLVFVPVPAEIMGTFEQAVVGVLRKQISVAGCARILEAVIAADRT